MPVLRSGRDVSKDIGSFSFPVYSYNDRGERVGSVKKQGCLRLSETSDYPVCYCMSIVAYDLENQRCGAAIKMLKTSVLSTDPLIQKELNTHLERVNEAFITQDNIGFDTHLITLERIKGIQ